MYSRKDVRYSLYRCRKPAEHPEKWQKIYDWVMEQKPAELDVEDFPEEWDVLITSDKQLKFVAPERDLMYIQSVCAEIKVKHSMGMAENFKQDLDDRQRNIVEIVELNMLDGKMNWENFGVAWSVTLDAEIGQIGTQLINVQPGQIPVTDEMIEASSGNRKAEELSEESQRRIADHEAGVSHNKSIDVTGGDEWQKLSSDEITKLKELLNRKD